MIISFSGQLGHMANEKNQLCNKIARTSFAKFQQTLW